MRISAACAGEGWLGGHAAAAHPFDLSAHQCARRADGIRSPKAQPSSLGWASRANQRASSVSGVASQVPLRENIRRPIARQSHRRQRRRTSIVKCQGGLVSFMAPLGALGGALNHCLQPLQGGPGARVRPLLLHCAAQRSVVSGVGRDWRRRSGSARTWPNGSVILSESPWNPEGTLCASEQRLPRCLGLLEASRCRPCRQCGYSPRGILGHARPAEPLAPPKSAACPAQCYPS